MAGQALALQLDLSKCMCEAGAVEWIREWFEDCVYTRWDLLSFLIGLSSICCWLVAQLPQFIQNIQMGSADALSPWFLFQWLSGDLLNLLGCLLSGNQLITQTFTAIYFIFADCLIIAQYVYYQLKNRDSLELDADCMSRPASVQDGFITAAAFSSPSNGLRQPLLPAKLSAIAEQGAPFIGSASNGSASNGSATNGSVVGALSVVSPPKSKTRRGVEEIGAAADDSVFGDLEDGGNSAATAGHEGEGSHIDRHQQQQQHSHPHHHHQHHNYHPVSFLSGRSGAALLAHAWQVPHLPPNAPPQPHHNAPHHLAHLPSAAPPYASHPTPPLLPPSAAASTAAAGTGGGAAARQQRVTDPGWRGKSAGDIQGGERHRGTGGLGGIGRRGGRLRRIGEEEDEGRPNLFPVVSDRPAGTEQRGPAAAVEAAGEGSRRRVTRGEVVGVEAGRGEGRRGEGQPGRVQFREEESETSREGEGEGGAGGEGERRKGANKVYSRREVRRVVERYGLEHGPPLLHSRLTIHHHTATPSPGPGTMGGEREGKGAGEGVREGDGERANKGERASEGGRANAGATAKEGARAGEGQEAREAEAAAALSPQRRGDSARTGVGAEAGEVAGAGEADSAAAGAAGAAGAAAAAAAGAKPQRPGALSLLLGSLMLLALSSSALHPLRLRGGSPAGDWGRAEAWPGRGRRLLAVQREEEEERWARLRGGQHGWQQQEQEQQVVVKGRSGGRRGNSSSELFAAYGTLLVADAALGDGSSGGLLNSVVPGGTASRGGRAYERASEQSEDEESDEWMAACREERKRRMKPSSQFIHQLGLMLGLVPGLTCVSGVGWRCASRNTMISHPPLTSPIWLSAVFYLLTPPARFELNRARWVSAAFYLGSRVSQIWQNAERGSAEGLSMAMFLCAFCGNLAYGTAILLRAPSLASLSGNLPWLVGSMGTLSLDITIYLQAQYLHRKTAPEHGSAVRPITVL